MSESLTIGLIGFGRIGQIHHANLLSHPAVGRVEVATLSGGEELSGQKVYRDYQELLSNHKCDAVIICSPTPTHAEIINSCCEQRIPVFCEKPLDLSLDVIRAVKRTVDASGVPVQLGFNRRWDPYFAELKNRIQSDDIGRVLQIAITSRDPALPHHEFLVSSGGMFLDMTIHDFDMALFLMDEEVTEVYAKAGAYIDPSLAELPDNDTATTILSFANGATCTIQNCRASGYGYDQRVEVFGTKGLISLPNKLESPLIQVNHAAENRALPLHFFLERYMDAYRIEMDAFIEVVLKGGSVPVGVQDAERATVLALAAQRSHETGLPVKI